MRDWVDVFGLEFFFCARVYIFLGEKKKERNPLQRGHVKDIGSSVGMQPYIGGVGV